LHRRCSNGTVPGVSAQAPAAIRPLSDDEFSALAELLVSHSPFDTDGLLGVLHAVAVAPGVIPPSAWFSAVLPNGVDKIDPSTRQQLVGLVLRLHNEVLDAIHDGEAIMPASDDLEACESFAAGYATAAALDPLWFDDDDRWTFASCVAYLGGQLDLVPKHTLAKLEALPDAKDTVRRDLAAIVATTNKTFRELRRAAVAQLTGTHAPRVVRVGRNQTCPCGSGKKFKRCCIDRRPAPGPT
jgi:uncharacterized protein YecA (UPF0149 family)